MMEIATNNSQHNGDDFDESFNVLCSSLGLQTAENEQIKTDMLIAEMKKLRQRTNAIYYECENELKNVKEAHEVDKQNYKAEIHERFEAVQFELAKMSNELQNMGLEKDEQEKFNEKCKALLSSINERKLFFN